MRTWIVLLAALLVGMGSAAAQEIKPSSPEYHYLDSDREIWGGRIHGNEQGCEAEDNSSEVCVFFRIQWSGMLRSEIYAGHIEAGTFGI